MSDVVQTHQNCIKVFELASDRHWAIYTMLIHTIIEDKSGMSLRIYKNVKLAANDAAVYSTQCLWPHRKPILTAIYPKIQKSIFE